jgi:putative molybdopterin biosynthesis protein
MRKEIILSEVLYTPQEIADLLRIKKSTVYELIKRGELKCKKIGKQFRVRKDDLEQYLNLDKDDNKTSQELTLHQPGIHQKETLFLQEAKQTMAKDKEESENAALIGDEKEESKDSYKVNQVRQSNRGIVLCGQDILLEILCNYMSRELKNLPIYRSYQGSYNGLYALYQDEVDVATVHLWDGVSGEYNKDFVKRMLPGTKHIRLHLVNRLQGFYVQKGNPKNISNFTDLLRNDIRMINREKGSGTRILLDEKLIQHGLDKSKIAGYEREVNSHLACAGAVARKSADVSIGIERISKEMAGIDFVPIQMESYDLVVKEEMIQSEWFTTIVNILNDADFRTEIMGMSGYDITDMGKIMN